MPSEADGPGALDRGELGEADARQLRELKEQIHRDAGFHCDGYKEKCLRRRLAVRMRARAVHRYADYAALLRRDRSEYDRLLPALTINVSKFFRNAEVWARLRGEVVPALFALDVPEVRIWSAGCAAGEEPYSVAILLLEHAVARGERRRLERIRVVGTDIDRAVLEDARRGEYGELALAETPPELRARWFLPGKRERLRDEVRELVEFRTLDLLQDPFPGGQHLILCRNVTIYFEREVQETLLQRLVTALAPGGTLVLGKVETIFGPLAREVRAVSNQERIFRRL